MAVVAVVAVVAAVVVVVVATVSLIMLSLTDSGSWLSCCLPVRVSPHSVMKSHGSVYEWHGVTKVML